MSISIALQVALFLASIAFIALAVSVAIVALQSRRRLVSLVSSIETMTATVNTLAVNSGDMVHSINELATRAQQHMDDVGHVVRSMRKWTDRAEPILETVGAVMAPPVVSWALGINRLRAGAMTFLRTFFQPTGNHDTTQRENDHVRL